MILKKNLFMDNAKYIQILVNWHDNEYDHGFKNLINECVIIFFVICKMSMIRQIVMIKNTIDFTI